MPSGKRDFLGKARDLTPLAPLSLKERGEQIIRLTASHQVERLRIFSAACGQMSIRLKLTLYWASVLAAILVIAAGSVFVIFERQQWAALDAALMEEADTSATAISRLGEPAAVDIARRLSQERDIGPGKRVRLVKGSGRILAEFGDSRADLPAVPQGIARRGLVDGRRHIYRFAIMPVSIGNHQAFLEDGVDASQVRGSIARLRTTLLIVTPLLLLACVAAGYWLAGQALGPIISLSVKLGRIGPKDLGSRLPIAAVEDEVARLTASINALLERLEAASLTERRFVSDAAHELRTPLTVLRTGLEIALSRERDNVEQQEAMQSALREVLALCKMVDELLTLARLNEEASAKHLPLNLAALVNEVVQEIEPLAQARNLTLSTVGEGNLMVEGNPDYLRRMVINLLDNAVKFTAQSGQIAVTLERRQPHAILHVSDSGPGIAEADLPFIFERFFRGNSASADGSGLGLSLCQEIARLHRGEIQARNKPEGGSEFVVTLPLLPGGLS